MKYLFLLAIKLYQLLVSPLIGPGCRFYPSCSAYAFESIYRHGTFRGGWLAVKRLTKCHPFHPGGIDLVPESLPKPTAGAKRNRFVNSAVQDGEFFRVPKLGILSRK